MVIEEVQTRRRIGIRHMSDQVLKKLMLSIGTQAESAKVYNTAYNYDMLASKHMA